MKLSAHLRRSIERKNLSKRLPEIMRLVAATRAQLKRTERAQERYHAATQKVLDEMDRLGLSNRDVAQIMGYSHQRIQQFRKARARKPHVPR